MTSVLVAVGKALTIAYLAILAASVIVLASLLVSFLAVAAWKDLRKWRRERWVAYCRGVVNEDDLERELSSATRAGGWMLERDSVVQDYRLPKEKHA